MNKTEKEKLVNDLNKKFSAATSLVFTDYKGLNVEEITQFRSLLRKSNVEYRVVKNTLAKIAAKETPVEMATELFKGPVAVVIGYDEPSVATKIVLNYAKGNEKLQVLQSLVEGQLFSEQDLKRVAELPSKEVLLSQLLSGMSSPASKLASALQATISRFAYALNALKDLKEKED